MVAFYKHDIAPWMDATADLSHEAYRLFHVVCQMIYLNEGPVRLNERYLAGACRLSLRAFRPALAELLEVGCLTQSEGVLTNFRAEEELESVSKNRENAANGGKNSGKSRRKKKNSNEINDPAEATLQEDRSLKDKTRLDDSEPNGSGAGAPIDLLGEVQPLDWRTKLFRDGLRSLVEITGSREAACRSMIGKWLRLVRDDARRVLRLIDDAKEEQVADPVAWIERSLSQRARPSQSVEQMLFARH